MIDPHPDAPPVPSRSTHDLTLDATLHSGDNARSLVAEVMNSRWTGPMAIDTETPGVDYPFIMRCVTVALDLDGEVHSIILDPGRREGDRALVADLLTRGTSLILHNATFDMPGLLHNRVVGIDACDRVVDTLVLARAAWPSVMTRKNLEALSVAHLGLEDFSGGMKLAFKAAGFRTIADGYMNMDLTSPIYRHGAMADTVATLRLEPKVREAALARTLDHPYTSRGATTRAEAERVIADVETVNRVMLRRVARGIRVDRDYLDRYQEEVSNERIQHEAELATVGLEGGSGKAGPLVNYLDSVGQLPQPWPRTATGKLQATKELLDSLDHPLAAAQRNLATTDKVIGYLEKVERQSEVTGRCHPNIAILGATATGRMSIGSPELQQFPAAARPVLIADDPEVGLTSIDWAQIEPVTLANMASDDAFLAPFEGGADLYEPIMRAAGIDRDLAKRMLLATMYGQGVTSLAARIGHTPESANQIKRQMLSTMKASARLMTVVAQAADDFGCVVTLGGRVLPVDKGFAYKAINYLVQGSALDVLHHSIIECHRAGLTDTLVLPMHDELVIEATEEQAAAVESLMLTPTLRFGLWTDRTPVLRTDRAHMGTSWQKV